MLTRQRTEVARPAVESNDDQILGELLRSLSDAPDLSECAIAPVGPQAPGRMDVEWPDPSTGTILVSVRGGRVVLVGDVPTFYQHRLAGLIAGEICGRQAVTNRLVVAPELGQDLDL